MRQDGARFTETSVRVGDGAVCEPAEDVRRPQRERLPVRPSSGAVLLQRSRVHPEIRQGLRRQEPRRADVADDQEALRDSAADDQPGREGSRADPGPQQPGPSPAAGRGRPAERLGDELPWYSASRKFLFVAD